MAKDNDSAYTAYDTKNFALSMGLTVCMTPVQSPESNGMAEGLVKTIKRDFVRLNSRDKARVVLEPLPGGLRTITRSPRTRACR
jgi:putative transposase